MSLIHNAEGADIIKSKDIPEPSWFHRKGKAAHICYLGTF